MSQYKNIASVNQNRLFSGIDPQSLKVNIKQGNFLEFQEGEIIYQKGDKDDSIYLIIEGEIKQKIKQPLTGTAVLRKGKNDFFGENEFLEKTQRISSAVANKNSILFKLSRKDVIVIASEHQTILKNLSNSENIPDLGDNLENETEGTNAGDMNDIIEDENQSTDLNLVDDSEANAETEAGQINWEEQNFENPDDFKDEGLNTESEGGDISIPESENEEQISWENTELDNIDELESLPPEEYQSDDMNIINEDNPPENSEDIGSAVTEGGEEIHWESSQLDDLNKLEDENLTESTGEGESLTSDLEGDEEIHWESSQPDDFNKLEDENLTESTGEGESLTSDLEGDKEISWESSSLDDLNKLEDENLTESTGEGESLTSDLEGNEELSWENSQIEETGNTNTENLSGYTDESPESVSDEDLNRLDDLNKLDDEHLTGEPEEGLPSGSESGSIDDKLQEENRIEDFNNINLNENPEESTASSYGEETDDEAGRESYDYDDMNRIPDDQIDATGDEDLNSEAGSADDEETYRTGDYGFDRSGDIDDKADEEQNNNQQSWDSGLLSENEPEYDNEIAGNYSEPGIEETADIANENEDGLYGTESDIEPREETPLEGTTDLDGEQEDGITESETAEEGSFAQPLSDEETGGGEKPVIGIYETEESGSSPALSDEDIYERSLRDLLYLYKSKNLADTVISVKELIKNFTGARLVNFYLVNDEKSELDLIDVEDNKLTHNKIPLGAGLTATAVLNNEPLNLQKPEEDPGFNSETDSFGGEQINELFCFPVNNNLNEVTALFTLADSFEGSFTEKDQKYMRIFSEHALNHFNNVGELENIPANVRIKATEEFSNFIVEDIKSPLLIIKHYADFIKRKAVPEELRTVSNYMLNQTDAVLSFSSVISDLINGNVSLNPDKFKLNELLDEILEMLAEYVDTRQVKLFKRYDSSASVNVDKSKFYYAMFQLTKIMCSNMPDGGSIYLVTSFRDNNIEIGLKDTGSGLPPRAEEILSKQIFDLTETDELSMELSISKKIIEDHGGRLELKKNSEKGSEFVIYLSASVSPQEGN